MSQPIEGTSVPHLYQPAPPLGEPPASVVHVPGQAKTPAEQVELLTSVFKGLPEVDVNAIIEIATTRKPFFGQ